MRIGSLNNPTSVHDNEDECMQTSANTNDHQKLQLQDLSSDLPKKILAYCSVVDQMAIMVTSKTFHGYVADLWSYTRSFALNNKIEAIDPLKVLSSMINLLEICVSNCGIINSRPSGGDLILQALSLNCHSLRRIDISSTSSVTNNGCAYIARGCPCLEYIDISFCPATDYGAVLILRGVHPELLSGNLPIPINGDEISSVAMMADSGDEFMGEEDAAGGLSSSVSTFSSRMSSMSSLPLSIMTTGDEDDHDQYYQEPAVHIGSQLTTAAMGLSSTLRLTGGAHEAKQQHDTAATAVLAGVPPPPPPGAAASSFPFYPRNNIVVRRQPTLLDGHYYCPWQVAEVHTYYPDGSFSFSRQTESKGWIIELEDRVRTRTSCR
jgi:hypothetical protein